MCRTLRSRSGPEAVRINTLGNKGLARAEPLRPIHDQASSTSRDSPPELGITGDLKKYLAAAKLIKSRQLVEAVPVLLGVKAR